MVLWVCVVLQIGRSRLMRMRPLSDFVQIVTAFAIIYGDCIILTWISRVMKVVIQPTGRPLSSHHTLKHYCIRQVPPVVAVSLYFELMFMFIGNARCHTCAFAQDCRVMRVLDLAAPARRASNAATSGPSPYTSWRLRCLSSASWRLA